MSDQRVVQKAMRGGDPEKTARHKGRAYQCLKCLRQPVTKEVIDVKGRIEEHILKMHVSLSSVPFYCRLCKFICQDKTTLQSHVTRYRRHIVMKKECGDVDDEAFLVENSSPYQIGSDDYIVLSKEDSYQYFLGKILAPGTTDILAGAIAAMDVDLLSPSISVDPKALFGDLDGNKGASTSADATMGNPIPVVCQTVVTQKVAAGVSTPQRSTGGTSIITSGLDNDDVDTNAATLPLDLTSPHQSTSEMISCAGVLGTSESQLEPMDLSRPRNTERVRAVVVASTDRHTASEDKSEETENILEQLLGREEEISMAEKRKAAEETEPPSAKRVRAISPALSTLSCSSTGSETCAEAVNSLKASLEEASTKIMGAVDSNSRAIRCLEKAMVEVSGVMASLVEEMKKTRRREEKRQESKDETREDGKNISRSERKREEAERPREKENDRGRMQSVLGRIYNQRDERSYNKSGKRKN